MMRRKTTALLVMLAMVAVPTGVALAKSAPVDLSGTVWQLTVRTQTKVKTLGSSANTSNVTLYFGENSDLGLAADEFWIDDGDGGIGGTWSDPKANGNLVLDFDQDGLTTAIVSQVSDLLSQELPSSTISDVGATITEIRGKCKCKPGKGASLSLKVSFAASATVDAETLDGTGAFSITGKPPKTPKVFDTNGAALNGTIWKIYGALNVQVKGMGRENDESYLFLGFGPNTDAGLVTGQFGIDTGDALMDGTWSDPEGNGDILLNFDQTHLADAMAGEVEKLVNQVMPSASVSEVVVTITDEKEKCTCKPGAGASVAMKVGFTVSFDIDGQPNEGTGSVSFASTGAEMAP